MVQLRELAADVSDQDLQMEINELHQRLGVVNTRLQQRQQALNLKQMLAQQSSVGPVPADATRGERDIEEKRQAILNLLQRDPSRTWSPAQVRKALREQGFTDPDTGSPVRNLLWRLAKDGKTINPKKGVYAIAPTAAPSVETAEPR